MRNQNKKVTKEAETTTVKIPRNFRLAPSINEHLEKANAEFGIDQTKIVEDALEEYLIRGGLSRRMQERTAKWGGGPIPEAGSPPSILKITKQNRMVRDTGFEPVTPTVSR